MEWLEDADKKKEERLAWLKKRLGYITASDASCLYGANPYKSIEELYNEKIADKVVEFPPNPAMSRGVQLEPKLRKVFANHMVQFYTDKNRFDPFEPAWVEHPEHRFIAATLDGLSQDKLGIVEVKYVGAKVLAAGVVPKHYWMQVQHQFLASGATDGYVIMGTDENNYKIIPIERDESFINSHLILCQQFWLNVLARKAPESAVQIVEDASAIEISKRYQLLLGLLAETERQIAEEREKLLSYVTKDEGKIGRLNVKKVITKGAVQYDTIEVLKGLDLDNFRKESKASWRITVDKE